MQGALSGCSWKRFANGVWTREVSMCPHTRSRKCQHLSSRTVWSVVTDEIDGAFDLVTCIEVLEHVPRESAERALDNLTGCTNRVLFSSTPDDDNEPTHVNLRPPDQWVKEFATRGFFPRTTKAGLVIAPQAIVFERGTPELSEALGQSELGRVELVRQLWDVREKLGSRDAKVRELEGQMQSQRSTNEELRATIGILRQGVAEAERGLEELRATTWWRVGRPVRGAITLVVTHVPAIRGVTPNLHHGPQRARGTH